MSLLRLLTAGKSLIGVPPLKGRYRMSNPGSMPKFRSTVNPFKAKAEKTEAQKSVAEPVAARLPRAAQEPEPAASVSDSDGRDATETAVQELEKPAVAA